MLGACTQLATPAPANSSDLAGTPLILMQCLWGKKGTRHQHIYKVPYDEVQACSVPVQHMVLI